MYHDVRATEKVVPIELETRKKTPDFAIVFINRQTKKLALLILDAKSNSDYAKYFPEKRNDYLSLCGLSEDGEQEYTLKMKQSWILMSGENCSSYGRTIECPPLNGKSNNEQEAIDELLNYENNPQYRKKLKNRIEDLSWSPSGFEVKTSFDRRMCWGAGYVFAHINCNNMDVAETDRFKLFLEHQVKLMETVLA